MSQKLFRDPLYDYISIDTNKYPWLLDLINTPEVQRLRYISQLGLSHSTYLGAVHSRLSHSMGVFHLIEMWLAYLERERDYSTYFEDGDGDKDALLAAALLHDVGHGPFSHATETFFGEHEVRSVNIILDPESSVNKVLTNTNSELPGRVAGLIAKRLPEGAVQPRLWQKALISSQLDADRLDFLRRDSLFSGAEYGNFDWYRIIHTTHLRKPQENPQKIDFFWPDKTKYAIEEYLFSRFYMYQGVYFHHTTRGFEKVLQKILKRAKLLAESKNFAKQIRPSLRGFFKPDSTVSSAKFLALTDYALLAQIAEWRQAKDNILRDLVDVFFARKDKFGFKVVGEFDESIHGLKESEKILKKAAAAGDFLRKKGLDPEYYLLTDDFNVGVYKPYSPEREWQQMTSENAIRIADSSGNPVEITKILNRLELMVKEPHIVRRYYCPYEHREKISALL